MTVDLGSRLAAKVRDIPDFPSPGVVFKDITPLLADREAFAATIDGIADHFDGVAIDRVLGIEARGFIVAAPVAYRFGAGFTPVRKVGKLPWQVEQEEYELEYGTDLLEIHRDAVGPGERVLDRRRRAGHRRHGGGDDPTGREARGRGGRPRVHPRAGLPARPRTPPRARDRLAGDL